MIKDTRGRKWFLRFKQYSNGWHWEAQCGGFGQSAAKLFETKVLAEDDARRSIQSHDFIRGIQEYLRRLIKRGSECQLTAADHKAITRAGANKAQAHQRR